MVRVDQDTYDRNNKETGVSSKATTMQSVKPEIDPDTKVPEELPVETPPSHVEIARRAYEIHVERGSDAGHDLDDWLRAEHELQREAAVNEIGE
jgi:hypothetical protein